MLHYLAGIHTLPLICTFSTSGTSTLSSANDVEDTYTPPRQRHKSGGKDGASLRTKSPRVARRRTHSKWSLIDEVAESPKQSPNRQSNATRPILPHLYDDLKSIDLTSGGDSVPSPEVGMQNGTRSRGSAGHDDRVLEDKEESRTHYRVLMSWESDYLRGSKATRGPILYAMERLPEQLEAIEG